MRHRIVGAAALMLWIASAGATYGAVRIGVRDGKRVIYNDGVGEAATVGRRSAGGEQWLAARISRPSQFDPLINRAANDH